MDTLARSYKYRLYPTPNQERMLEAWQAACWEVQRACVLQRRMAWDSLRNQTAALGQNHRTRARLPTYHSQQREITELRATYPALADVPCIPMQAIAQRVDNAYDRMRKARRERKRTKVKWKRHPSLIGLMFLGEEYGTERVHIGHRFSWWKLARSSKLGKLKVRMHRAMPEGTTIKQAHITRAADGWYISFSCVIPAPPPLPAVAKPVNGVDLGCIHRNDKQRVAAVDDERDFETTDNMKRSQKRLAILQRLVSPTRKVKGGAKAADPKSKRTAKRRKRIARLHQTIARQREHNQQYIARRLVDTANATAFEDVKWGNLRKRGKPRKAGDNRRGGRKAKKGLNRAMATASPARLVQLTEEKAEAAGRIVVKVDARNTSQVCSTCGVIGERKGLGVRVWTCEACGTIHDRDVNAAKNIRTRAELKLGICRSDGVD